MKRTRVSRFKNTKYTQYPQQYLYPDDRVEVLMDTIDDNPDAIYEVVIHDFDDEKRELSVFFEDDPERPQKLHKVSYDSIAPVHSAIRDARFSPGDTVEVKYRVDDESPYGWWIATIKECLPLSEGYIVAFPPDQEELEVKWNQVRSQTFF